MNAFDFGKGIKDLFIWVIRQSLTQLKVIEDLKKHRVHMLVARVNMKTSNIYIHFHSNKMMRMLIVAKSMAR